MDRVSNWKIAINPRTQETQNFNQDVQFLRCKKISSEKAGRFHALKTKNFGLVNFGQKFSEVLRRILERCTSDVS